ncbi:M56 family metallopeptidase [Paenibacillus psychroresistens]|uniref:M56 family metallopeptidase n=1 Tax=Paenibacillus psychroresistens TaxID=1778678 RepID=A0A6B8RHG4_9BACL|nr:M56 family metallopeptidase [Paenibacillus psychroresistens]QGQ95660.1 M56 family metallopeptidase [Paenibacillus psychroresistens]
MNLLQMNVSAGILILVIVALRAIAGSHLPRTMFIALWMIALFRLILPFSISSPYGIYTLINRIGADFLLKFGVAEDNWETGGLIHRGTEYVAAGYKPLWAESLVILWIIGAVMLALIFAISYYQCRREMKTALPIKGNAFIEKWQREQKLSRTVKILVSDKIATPITYGIFKPRIILPKMIDLGNEMQMRYILAHEMIHIKRFDALWKLLLFITLICHWYNPMVWLLFIFMNRDLEIACDERVIQVFGENSKSDYALTLIAMAEKKMKFTPLYSSFSINVTEERIKSIMQFKKASFLGIMLVCIIVAGSTTVFAEKVVNLGFQLRGFIQINSERFSFELVKSGKIIVKDADGKVVSKAAVGRDGKAELTDGSGRIIRSIQLNDLADPVRDFKLYRVFVN